MKGSTFARPFSRAIFRLTGLLALLLIVLPALQMNAYANNSSMARKKLPGNKNFSEKPTSNLQNCLHGGIEVGASGVKAIAIRVLETDEGYDAIEVYAPKTANTNVMQGVEKTHKMSLEPIKDTAVAVESFCRQMMEKGVPSYQIYIVGSSGLWADNLIDLSNKVKELTGRDMTFLQVGDEVAYTISGTVPKYIRRYVVRGKNRRVKRIDNRGQSILIDVGSGNTKGGYQERISITDSNEFRFVTFGISIGSKTLAERVSKDLPPDAGNMTLASKAEENSQELIRQPLNTELERKPGLRNRPRVYLTGGIVWALATLTYPENRKPYVALTADDIDHFYNKAANDPQNLLNPDLSNLDSETREKAESDINSIRSAFSHKQLLAGAYILKTLSGEMGFRDKGKSLRFARKGYIAWILRYVNLKSTETSENLCR